MAGFNGLTSKPYGKIMLDMSLHKKVISVDFYIMNYNVPHNGLFGRDMTIKIRVVSSVV